MTAELQNLLDPDKPTRIRELVAALDEHELSTYRAILADMRRGCQARGLARMAAVFDELAAIAVEDLGRRNIVQYGEVTELQRLLEK